MNELDLNEVLITAKNVYKKSILNDYAEVQDELLSIITMIEILKNNLTVPKKRTVSSRETISDEKYKRLACISYVLSEFGHKVFYPEKTQSQAIEYLANILNTKPATLRNVRDFLDSYTNSPREGWKKELSPKLKEIFEECSNIVPNEAVIERAKNIIVNYGG